MFDGVGLYKRYSSVLSGPLYPEVADGWATLVEEFLQDMEENARFFDDGAIIVTDIKEKFGGMRIYVNYNLPSETITYLEEIVCKYEKLASRTCEYCGDNDHTMHPRHGYWDVVACEDCFNKHFKENKDNGN